MEGQIHHFYDVACENSEIVNGVDKRFTQNLSGGRKGTITRTAGNDKYEVLYGATSSHNEIEEKGIMKDRIMSKAIHKGIIMDRMVFSSDIAVGSKVTHNDGREGRVSKVSRDKEYFYVDFTGGSGGIFSRRTLVKCHQQTLARNLTPGDAVRVKDEIEILAGGPMGWFVALSLQNPLHLVILEMLPFARRWP